MLQKLTNSWKNNFHTTTTPNSPNYRKHTKKIDKNVRTFVKKKIKKNPYNHKQGESSAFCFLKNPLQATAMATMSPMPRLSLPAPPAQTPAGKAAFVTSGYFRQKPVLPVQLKRTRHTRLCLLRIASPLPKKGKRLCF